MKKNKLLIYPTISFIIPTYTGSEKYIKDCILAIKNQNYPKEKIEVLVTDNQSCDKTQQIAKNLGAKVITVQGKPPQVCKQRNIGAMEAKNQYLFFLDHDMQIEQNLLNNFAQHVTQTKEKIDAWFVPEKILASSWFLTKIRNFERSYYDATVIDAVRIIKKSSFMKTSKYDLNLSNGPADWDFDLQLKNIGAKFDIIDTPLFHNEKRLSLTTYLFKKNTYSDGIDKYIAKWQDNRQNFIKVTLKKQFNPIYRLFVIFFEKNNYLKTLLNLHLYFCFLGIKCLMFGVYAFNKFKKLYFKK